MPACHAVVRGPARLTQKKITSNRQTTGISGTATAFCDFPNCLSRGGKSRTGSLGIPPIPQRRLRAFTWQSWLPQPSSAPRPPLHRTANRYGTSAPGVPYHVGAAYVFIHFRGIQARLKKQDFFLSRTPTRHTNRERTVGRTYRKNRYQNSSFSTILINLTEKDVTPPDHGRNPPTSGERPPPAALPAFFSHRQKIRRD